MYFQPLPLYWRQFLAWEGWYGYPGLRSASSQAAWRWRRFLVLLSLHILRREPKDLRERWKNGEILLLTFEQIMALYNAAPEKWDMQVDGPTYYPHGKERDGLLVFHAAQRTEALPAVVRLAALPRGGRRPVPDDGQGAALHAGGLRGPSSKIGGG